MSSLQKQNALQLAVYTPGMHWITFLFSMI